MALPKRDIVEGSNLVDSASLCKWHYDVVTKGTSSNREREGADKSATIQAGRGLIVRLSTLTNDEDTVFGSEHGLELRNIAKNSNDSIKKVTLFAKSRSGRDPGERGHYRGTVLVEVGPPGDVDS